MAYIPASVVKRKYNNIEELPCPKCQSTNTVMAHNRKWETEGDDVVFYHKRKCKDCDKNGEPDPGFVFYSVNNKSTFEKPEEIMMQAKTRWRKKFDVGSKSKYGKPKENTDPIHEKPSESVFVYLFMGEIIYTEKSLTRPEDGFMMWDKLLIFKPREKVLVKNIGTDKEKLHSVVKRDLVECIETIERSKEIQSIPDFAGDLSSNDYLP